MKASRFIASTLTLGTMMLASAAAAQNTTGGAGVQFGVGGGLAMPIGDFGEGLGMGFDVHGMLGFNPAALPFGMRVDVGFNQFGFEDEFGDGNFRIISGTANALLKIPATSISPYVIGGLGVFNGKADVEGAEGSTRFGINVGGGLQFNLSGMATHLEAKYVNVFFEGESGAYIPITFGIMFGGAGGTANAKRVRVR
jgi:opacity protein-like surface antigen